MSRVEENSRSATTSWNANAARAMQQKLHARALMSASRARRPRAFARLSDRQTPHRVPWQLAFTCDAGSSSREVAQPCSFTPRVTIGRLYEHVPEGRAHPGGSPG